MHKVANGHIISQIAKKSFNANKLRNLFSVVAIALTTILFTTLFTVGMSMVESLEESTMRQVGGSAHGGFKYLSEEEFNLLKQHPLIKESTYSIPIGVAENPELSKRPSEIRYATQRQAEWMFAQPTVGNMPKESNEIAMDTLVLDALGIPYEVGQEIKLEYTLNDKKIKDSFVLSGYWKGDPVIPASQIWISKDYLEMQLANFIPNKDKSIMGTISMDVMFENTWGIEEKFDKIIIESGYTQSEINYGVNWAYMNASGSFELTGILAVIGALALIMFCGYLIIFNIFYISVSKDIRFYGLLKTIGTTSKQIGKLIRKQALRLCLIGIPMGLVLGYGIGVVMTPHMLGQVNIAVANIAFDPVIFIGAALFAIMTVLISTQKPSKIAGRVSPIEALRSVDVDNMTRHLFKKSHQFNVCNMAMANVLRNQKKTGIVILSLSLSLVIFNATYAMVKGFDMNLFLSERIITDFVIADAGYFNVYIGYDGQTTLTKDVIEEMSTLPGIEEMGNIRFVESRQEIDEALKVNMEKLIQDYPDYFTGFRLEELTDSLVRRETLSHLYGIDQMIVDYLQVYEGTIDEMQWASGEYVIVSAFDEMGKSKYYEVGDTVNLFLPDGKSKSYKVMAIANIPHNISVRHGHITDINFYLPNEEFMKQVGERAPMLTVFNVGETQEQAVETFMKQYCETIQTDLNYESKATYEAEFRGMQKSYEAVGYVLSCIIGFIGIINFINTIMTSIMTRRRELAMLQSIGMTRRQLVSMLVCEGLTYAVLTVGFVLTIGMLMSYLIVQAIVGNIWFFSYQLTILPILLCIPVIGVLAAVIPMVCYQVTSKESIVERLRERE